MTTAAVLRNLYLDAINGVAENPADVAEIYDTARDILLMLAKNRSGIIRDFDEVPAAIRELFDEIRDANKELADLEETHNKLKEERDELENTVAGLEIENAGLKKRFADQEVHLKEAWAATEMAQQVLKEKTEIARGINTRRKPPPKKGK